MFLLPMRTTNGKVTRENKLFAVSLTVVQKRGPSSHENCSLTTMQTQLCMQSPGMKNLGIFYIKAIIKENSNQLISARQKTKGRQSKAIKQVKLHQKTTNAGWSHRSNNNDFCRPTKKTKDLSKKNI